jgi:hypothetical protein
MEYVGVNVNEAAKSIIPKMKGHKLICGVY